MFVFAVACSDVEEEKFSDEIVEDSGSEDVNDGSLCPTLEEDECMTQELYDECVAKEETCEGALLSYGGCPYTGWDCQ